MKISHQNTKIMAFKGTEPITSKIVIDNMILEHVNILYSWAVIFDVEKRRTYISKSQNFYK
jgi:hypothetical protein